MQFQAILLSTWVWLSTFLLVRVIFNQLTDWWKFSFPYSSLYIQYTQFTQSNLHKNTFFSSTYPAKDPVLAIRKTLLHKRTVISKWNRSCICVHLDFYGRPNLRGVYFWLIVWWLSLEIHFVISKIIWIGMHFVILYQRVHTVLFNTIC